LKGFVGVNDVMGSGRRFPLEVMKSQEIVSRAIAFRKILSWLNKEIAEFEMVENDNPWIT
jgi:hypothetical protein